MGLLALVVSCQSKMICKEPEMNVSKVDTSTNFKIFGRYCMAYQDKFSNFSDSVMFKFEVFNLLNGKKIERGVLWLYGKDTLSHHFIDGVDSLKIAPDSYRIEAWSLGFDGTKTKRIKLKEKTEYIMRFYLGTTRTS